MRVLTILNSLDIGGIENTFLECVPFLQKNNIKLYVCVYKRNGIIERDFQNLGVSVLGIIKTNSILLDFLQVYFLIKKHNINIVHSRFGFSSGGYILACLFSSIPSIVSIHNTHPARRKNFFIRIIQSYSLFLHKVITINLASKIVGHSKANLNSNYLNWQSKNKFRLIYNGINFSKMDTYKTEAYDEFRKKFNGKDVILHIGSFRDQKNHKFLLKAFSKLDPIVNNKVLILIGDGPLKQNILKLVKELKIESNVIFTGNQKDLGRYFDVSSILFFPSIHEGFGNVIIEAQYMNIPVCGSDILPLNESIYPDYNKYRFNPYKIEEATLKLNEIINDNNSGKLEKSKIEASNFVKRNFAIETMAKKLADLYSDLQLNKI